MKGVERIMMKAAKALKMGFLTKKEQIKMLTAIMCRMPNLTKSSPVARYVTRLTKAAKNAM